MKSILRHVKGIHITQPGDPPMYTTTDTARPGGIRSGLRRSEDWLDRKGKWAWIAAMVLGFVLFWPVGLALLAYMIWGKHMFARSCGHRRAHDHKWGREPFRAGPFTGNSAFDSYKAEALRRLEDEQDAFESFLDKTEFDAFMEDRARATAAQDAAQDAATAGDLAKGAPKPEASARPGEY